MSTFRRLHRILTFGLLLVVLTFWFVVPICSWAPKLAGFDHVVRIELDGGDTHFSIQNIASKGDRYFGPHVRSHNAPFDEPINHANRAIHMPHFERTADAAVALSIPAPVVTGYLRTPLATTDLSLPRFSDLSDTDAPAEYHPPTESQKTVVLLI
jgi:hypothetical protein